VDEPSCLVEIDNLLKDLATCDVNAVTEVLEVAVVVLVAFKCNTQRLSPSAILTTPSSLLVTTKLERTGREKGWTPFSSNCIT